MIWSNKYGGKGSFVFESVFKMLLDNWFIDMHQFLADIQIEIATEFSKWASKAGNNGQWFESITEVGDKIRIS